MNFSKKKSLLVFFAMMHFLLDLEGAPRPWDRDEEGRVARLEKTLQNEKNYVLFLAEDFEGGRPWEFYRSDSFLNYTEYSGNLPDSSAFPLEKEMYRNQGYPNIQTQTSFLLQTYVENPKTDHWDLRPGEPLLLPLGLPIQAFLWVYSEGHHIALDLIVSQKKSKDVKLPLGVLNFFGWRRLEVPINLPKENARLIQSSFLPVSVKGFRIATQPTQKKGAFHLYFDNLTFLLDTSTFTYSGSEIQDTWGKKR
ncbi:flagellar assembly protein FlaA [Leptospira ognonensis]|uniref:Flagellar assembly protein FlaA n=1 Tax=Leptospira ognonensis TaxID=2484945 RepID=A0A4V6QM45_9LEPT|nr:flagellar filament outer layer protein FlaA [Leptospira ognonensis]TGL58243.1 flagellar assembly protein FlaA [Leptospira ognonensis]